MKLKLSVWEDKLRFKVGKSYIIEGISVRSFNDEKYLTTTTHTSVTQTDDMITIEPEHHESYGKGAVASVMAVSISSYKACLVCNTKFEIVDHNVATIKCHKCNLSTFLNRLLDSSVTKFVLKDDLNKLCTYNVLDIAMKTFLQNVANTVITDFIETQLLEYFSTKTFRFTVSDKDELVSSITHI